jgi:cyclopropane-fatty-acyl-phospholipid synthase
MSLFPLDRLLRALVKRGELTAIDAGGGRTRFGGDIAEDAFGARLTPVTMRLHNAALAWKIPLNPELHVGEAWMDGALTFEEGSTLRDFLTLFSANRYSVAQAPLQKQLFALRKALRRFQQSNRVGEAQRNVSHHYDIGNEFYRLFLDRNLLYSCAYFRKDGETLEQAQRNKLRLVAAKLRLKPGMRVLDIGCGWGETAMYLARVADVHVTGVTLAAEQQRLAAERAAAAGLSGRTDFRLLDYRQLDGRFDRIVSIGMFEHVGVAAYDEFFAKANSLMGDDGVMVLHSIGHMSPPGSASPWLRKYIFPGAYSPALSEVFAATERNQLWCTDLEVLRVHYATTLRHWADRFAANRDKVVAMYDERFARMWEFYLISAEMMFRTGSQMVFHMQLSRRRDAAPLQRDYVVREQEALEEREKILEMTV